MVAATRSEAKSATRPGRRANGDGLIRQRSDGRWEGRVLLPTGKPKSVYGKTQKDVREKLQSLRQQVADGRLVGSGRQTVKLFLEQWLASKQSQVAFKTYDTYRGITQTHLIPTLGHLPLATLGAEHVQKLLDEVATRRSTRTTQACRDVLRIALNQAVKRRLVRYNVATDVEPPRVAKRDVQPLSREQAKAILRAFEGDRLETLVTVALTFGLRRGELMGLRWSDVDLDTGVMHVRYQVQRQGKDWKFILPKSKEGRRALPMPAFLIEALRTHRAKQLEERLQIGPAWTDLDLVFPSEVGTPQDGMNITHRFQRGLKRARLPHMKFHDLRHGAATILLANGFMLKEVQEILGHSTYRMTAEVYAHIAPELKQEWAARMQQALG